MEGAVKELSFQCTQLKNNYRNYLELVTLLGVTEASHKSHSAQELLETWEFGSQTY